MIALNNARLQSLLDKAKKKERKYEWLQAADVYTKVINLLEEKNVLKTAELQEKIGYCYFRAAFQAQQPEQNKKRVNNAIKAYDAAVNFLEQNMAKGHKIEIMHNKGWILFLRSWLENDLPKKKNLLDEWWELESNNFTIYDEIDDPVSKGKIFNDLLELSAIDRFFVTTDNLELTKIAEECIRLGEKTINILSKENNIHELARAFCWTTWYYGFALLYRLMEDKRDEIGIKALNYSRKAIQLSQKTKDAWLIGWSNNAAAFYRTNYKEDFEIASTNTAIFLEQGMTAQDNYMLSVGYMMKGWDFDGPAYIEEDPDKQREGYKAALNCYEKARNVSDLSNFFVVRLMSRSNIASELEKLASFETNLETKRSLLKQIIKITSENLELAPEWSQHIYQTFEFLSISLLRLSETLIDVKKKQHSLSTALKYGEKSLILVEKFIPLNYYLRGYFNLLVTQIKIAIAELEQDNERKTSLLEDAVLSAQKGLLFFKKNQVDSSKERKLVEQGNSQYQTAKILFKLYSLTRKDDLVSRAIELYNNAIENFKKTNYYSNSAECYWQKAKIHDQLSEYLDSSRNYEFASQAYLRASEKLPKLEDFYANHSRYMQAWNEIEQAKYDHSRENYLQAKNHYEKAGRIHEKLDDWNYLSSNYFAWAKLEQAEESSRTDKTQVAIEDFQEAIKYFKETETNIKTKINENPTAEEQDLLNRIMKASDLRQKYCHARILMEKAKLLGREGNYFDSSISYGKAAETISAIVEKIDVEIERKELEYLSILCQAWEKMANAEEKTSSESYLAAAELFDQAKEHCYTKKGSLWALGNSTFCKGLASGLRYKTSMNLKENALAKQYIKDSASSYSEAGFRNASEYAKATLRLFDAYAFMNQAETEIDPEKKTKQYQMAENLLQIAAGSFMKAKQPEKKVQVQNILANVKEEKELAVSLSQVMQAPTIASSTSAFSAPTPSSEISVGLESFEHANVQANLVTTVKQVKVGESFCLSVEFVNAGREPALLLRVDDFVPGDFVVVKKPEIYRLEESTLNMKGKQIAALKLVEAKLVLQPSKKGKYQLNPKVIYLDERGQNKSLQLKTLEIQVEEVILEDRVTTGTEELDSLLLGGIPEEYAVVLSGPPCDERELVIKNFLKAGAKQKEVTFYITTEATELETMLDNPNFFLFLCNPKPKTKVPDLPNVHRLQSKADITNLGIALTKANRNIDQTVTQKRICVEILSDVLVKHGINTMREWISGLITDMGAKGFTMLAVLDSEIHTPEQSKAVLHLFDGEISILQSDDPLDCKKSILVKKLRNQDYIKNPICLT